MTGTKVPVDPQRPLRNLFSGIVGFPDEDQLDRLTRLASRAIRSRQREEKREENLREQGVLRMAAVDRRRKRQMLAARYARDRRKKAETTIKEG